MSDAVALGEAATRGDFCYITTTGRVSGRPHTIEIWFGHTDGTLYILSGGGERSDWVKNGRRRPDVRVKIGRRTYDGVMRIVQDTSEGGLARRLLLEKYTPRYAGDLTDWGKNALPVAVDLRV